MGAQKQFFEDEKPINFKGLKKDLKNNNYYGERIAYFYISMFITMFLIVLIGVFEIWINLNIRQLTNLEMVLPQVILVSCFLINVFFYMLLKFRKFSRNKDKLKVLIKNFENREDNEFNKKVLMVLNSKYKFLHFPTIVYLTGQICHIKLSIEEILKHNNVLTVEDINEVLEEFKNKRRVKKALLCLVLKRIFNENLKSNDSIELVKICEENGIILNNKYDKNLIKELERIKELKEIGERIIKI